jgi:hypothetical protein
MPAKPYMMLYPAHYLADTMHLDCEQHGAYMLMLMAAWQTKDGSLPLDMRHLAKICRVSTRKFTQIIWPEIQDYWPSLPVHNPVDNLGVTCGQRIYNARLRAELVKIGRDKKTR